jgi:hypothetical protein
VQNLLGPFCRQIHSHTFLLNGKSQVYFGHRPWCGGAECALLLAARRIARWLCTSVQKLLTLQSSGVSGSCRCSEVMPADRAARTPCAYLTELPWALLTTRRFRCAKCRPSPIRKRKSTGPAVPVPVAHRPPPYGLACARPPSHNYPGYHREPSRSLSLLHSTENRRPRPLTKDSTASPNHRTLSPETRTRRIVEVIFRQGDPPKTIGRPKPTCSRS